MYNLKLMFVQFDSRISIASAFIRKLQTNTVDNSVRGPYLAPIEIERRHLRGKGNKMSDILII
jgi:hypothetical protein